MSGILMLFKKLLTIGQYDFDEVLALSSFSLILLIYFSLALMIILVQESECAWNSELFPSVPLKGTLSCLRQILATESPLKMMKNAF